jgi:hypothetical protein
MGWGLGYDDRWHRWIGYGVPAYCDHPGCRITIHRGLSYVCGKEPYGGEKGCGLYFCGKHQGMEDQLCEVCRDPHSKGTFKPKPEHPQWVRHLRYDKSWAEWRAENPKEVKKLDKRLDRLQRRRG